MDKILLLGAYGQVGRELSRSLLPLGEVCALDRDQCDMNDHDKLIEVIREFKPQTIVNAAAYTAVDQAESNVDTVMQINAEAPAVLAEQARKLGALLVDYSTDYVFDGSKQDAYFETDEPNPLNVYGRSKLAGLRAIEQSGCRYLVFRVSWVYGRIGHNFVNTMLRLVKDKTEIKVVADQWGSPTPADLIADVTAGALLEIRNGVDANGLFNLIPDGQTSWCQLAEAIFEHLRQIKQCDVPRVIPIKTHEYITAAARPANSRLNTDKIKSVFGFAVPHWRIPLLRILEDIIGL